MKNCRPVARIGRAAVSKTACWGFESLLACQLLRVAGHLQRVSAIEAESTRPMKDFFLKIKDRFRRSIEFIRDVRKELNMVSWPSRTELTGTTIVVIVAVFLFGFFLYLVDMGVGAGMNYLFSRAGR